MTTASARQLVKIAFTLLLGVISSANLLACPVCFGQSDSPMAQGLNLGILFLLGVVGFVLASFGAFFIYLARRARLAAPPHAEDSLSCSSS
jgi:hypothetical protein